MNEEAPIYMTWRLIRDVINSMPEDRLDDAAQIMKSSSECPVPLNGIYSLDTVGYFSTGVDENGEEPMADYTRGIIDNAHHPEHYVFLSDENPYDQDGNTHFIMTDEGMIGNRTGKNYGPSPFAGPICDPETHLSDGN